VCFSMAWSGLQTSIRPVMPRCTIHCAVSGEDTDALADFRRDFRLRGEDARPPFSRSKTMCLPILRTPAIRFDSRVLAISDAADLSTSGLDPIQIDSITSPVTRLAKPRAIVSTSGSSGMKIVYKASGYRHQASGKPSGRRLKPDARTDAQLPSFARRGYH
jgi:hypothetical protein